MNVPFWTVGKTIDLTALEPGDMTPGIIGGTLAKLNRFGGRTPEPFSVAAHSVLVEHLCPPALRPWALLHDAHEAFLGDWIVPAVWMIARHDASQGGISAAITGAKTVIDRSIAAAWGVLPDRSAPALVLADRVALEAEAFLFLGKQPPSDLEPEQGTLFDSALSVLADLPRDGDWRGARDLWISRVRHYASLGLLTPPRATEPAGMVPGGQS